MLVGGESVQHSAIGGLLVSEIERCIYAQSALVYLFAPVFRFEISPDFFHKIWRNRARSILDVQTNGGTLRFRRFGSGDLSVFQQSIDHHVATMKRALRIAQRRIDVRPFGNAGKQRSFFEAEVFRMLPEIELRSCFESIDAMSEEDLVGVHGKDLLLGEMPLDLHR